MKKTPTDRLVLPDGVSAGAAIGAGGRHVREIGTRHNVRCIVNPPQREIEFLGHQANVANAIADFREVFAQILATCVEPEKHTPVNAAGESFIHLRAMARTHEVWQFERRGTVSLKADTHAKHYDYRLVPASARVEPCVSTVVGSNIESTWLHEFDPAFRIRMARDVTCLYVERPERAIRLKAAIGLTCFALRDPSLASQTFSWSHLQTLQQVDQIQARWSSVWDTSSPPVAALLGHLLALAAEQRAPVTTTLTVYVGTVDATNCEDVVVKYRYRDYTWLPLASLRPRRVLLAQYDIGLNHDRACRIRAYTHEVAEPTRKNRSITDHLDVVPPTVGSHFLTTVVARPTMPRNRFIRGRTVKDKLQVDWQGLRFIVSFMNKRRTRVRIECELLYHNHDAPAKHQAEEEAVMSEAVETLTDKVMAAIAMDC
jgi:hypothetical protein